MPPVVAGVGDTAAQKDGGLVREVRDSLLLAQ